jgi:hypothetical protein
VRLLSRFAALLAQSLLDVSCEDSRRLGVRAGNALGVVQRDQQAPEWQVL